MRHGSFKFPLPRSLISTLLYKQGLTRWSCGVGAYNLAWEVSLCTCFCFFMGGQSAPDFFSYKSLSAGAWHKLKSFSHRRTKPPHGVRLELNCLLIWFKLNSFFHACGGLRSSILNFKFKPLNPAPHTLECDPLFKSQFASRK